MRVQVLLLNHALTRASFIIKSFINVRRRVQIISSCETVYVTRGFCKLVAKRNSEIMQKRKIKGSVQESNLRFCDKKILSSVLPIELTEQIV